MGCDQCPKCGGQFSGPRYDENENRLRFICLRCGYRKTEAPRDAQREAAPPPWRKQQ